MNIDILRRSFGDREFSTAEAAWALGLRRVGGTLSRLKTSGLLVKAGPGRYRLAPPSHPDSLRARAADERLRVLLEGPVPLALDGPDAVALWTGGRYRPPTPPGPRVVYLVCAERDAGAAAAALESLEIPWAPAGHWPSGRALKAVLRAVPRLATARRGGTPVITRREVLRIIRADPGAYEGAEEWMLP
jgi:hypothetical protein